MKESQAWRKIAPWMLSGWTNEQGQHMAGMALVPAMKTFTRSCAGEMRFRLDAHFIGGPSVCASDREWSLLCLFLALEAADGGAA